MANSVEFNAAITRYQSQKIGRAGKVVSVELATELGRRIVKRMPVKTGAARGNVKLVIGRNPFTANKRVRDPSGNRTIAAIRRSAERLAAYSRYRIGSALPYIPRLERGYSRQAPRGMFRISMQEIKQRQRQLANKALRQLGRFNVR